jgi:hypothetical protein
MNMKYKNTYYWFEYDFFNYKSHARRVTDTQKFANATHLLAWIHIKTNATRKTYPIYPDGTIAQQRFICVCVR